MIGENKRCPFCTAGIIMPEEHEAKLPTIEHDNGCFLRRYREIGFTPEDLKRWNTRSPIANNGVSLEDIMQAMEDIEAEVGDGRPSRYEYAYGILTKLQPTAINNGVSFDSIVDKLTHLNGDHLMGLELNNIHIIANFITKLPTTSPRVSGEVKHADNCPSVKGTPVCTCEHLRRYS